MAEEIPSALRETSPGGGRGDRVGGALGRLDDGPAPAGEG